MADFDLEGPVGGDDDLTLPKATVAKMIAEVLPEDIVCAKETRDLVLNCCVEFIHLLASAANEICEKTTKKTICPEHIFDALKQLGFEEFLDEVKQEHGLHKQEQKQRETKKAASSRFASSGMSEEELQRQQEELFKAARQKYEQRLQESSSAVQSPVLATMPEASSSSTSVVDTNQVNETS